MTDCLWPGAENMGLETSGPPIALRQDKWISGLIFKQSGSSELIRYVMAEPPAQARA